MTLPTILDEFDEFNALIGTGTRTIGPVFGRDITNARKGMPVYPTLEFAITKVKVQHKRSKRTINIDDEPSTIP